MLEDKYLIFTKKGKEREKVMFENKEDGYRIFFTKYIETDKYSVRGLNNKKVTFINPKQISQIDLILFEDVDKMIEAINIYKKGIISGSKIQFKNIKLLSEYLEGLK